MLRTIEIRPSVAKNCVQCDNKKNAKKLFVITFYNKGKKESHIYQACLECGLDRLSTLILYGENHE